MSDRAITDLVAAVTDGEYVDWPAAEVRLASSQNHRLGTRLKALSHLNDTSRTHAPSQLSSRRMPWMLEANHPLAIVVVALGAVGEAAAWSAGASRLAILLVVLLTYAGAAAFLDLSATDRRARALALSYWCIAAAFSSTGRVWAAQHASPSWWINVAVLVRPEAFFAACLWQFAREFPLVSHFSRLDRICVGAARAALVLGIVLFAANLLPALAPASAVIAAVAPLQRLTPRNGEREAPPALRARARGSSSTRSRGRSGRLRSK